MTYDTLLFPPFVPGYSLQADHKTRERDWHPDRDAQFRQIDRMVRTRLAKEQPAVSVDYRSWWPRMGCRRFGRAEDLLITADGGGSNGLRCRLWKICPRKFVDERPPSHLPEEEPRDLWMNSTCKPIPSAVRLRTSFWDGLSDLTVLIFSSRVRPGERRIMTNFTKFAFGTLPLAVAAVLSFNAQAQAAIIAQYHLGELGSVSGSSNLPQDSSGNGYNFINQCCGSVPTVDTTNVAPGTGSTASLSFGGGYYATTGNPSITDNFQLDLWARATDTSTTNELFVSNSDNTGSLKIHEIHNGSETDWAASFSNVAWIGAANGAGQPVTLNAWEHIQVAVVNGTATLYLNGVAQPSTASSSQFSGWAGMHLGVTPGGQTHFTGNIDEVTISSVPEPACLGILGVGAMGLLARRRRDG